MLLDLYRSNNPFVHGIENFFENGFSMDYEIPLNLSETDDQYVVTAQVPRVKKEDVQIELQNNLLKISYELKTEDSGKILFKEFSDGKYIRTIKLPNHIDEKGVEAKLEKGLLSVILPKSEKSQLRKINIK